MLSACDSCVPVFTFAELKRKGILRTSTRSEGRRATIIADALSLSSAKSSDNDSFYSVRSSIRDLRSSANQYVKPAL